MFPDHSGPGACGVGFVFVRGKRVEGDSKVVREVRALWCWGVALRCGTHEGAACGALGASVLCSVRGVPGVPVTWHVAREVGTWVRGGKKESAARARPRCSCVLSGGARVMCCGA